MVTQGRSAPCHCGSGRKYKNCHLRRDKEQKMLVATAMHEAGHVIASFHYGVSIDEQGVFINDEGSGFTDSNKTEKWGENRIIDLGRDIRMAHFVISVIGAVVEFRYRSMTLDTIQPSDIKHWMADFAGAMGCQGTRRTSSMVAFDPGEYEAAGRVTFNCFAMLTQPEGVAARVSLGGTDVGGEMKKAMLFADKMASVYAAEIKQFADLLLAKNKVSKDECAEWARNFQRKEVAVPFVASGLVPPNDNNEPLIDRANHPA
jgi:hypothetical protein